ncbi:MAG: ACT domain-containing protein, partial [Epulopiscium sp.]|nr:ACT domain-containing protein [Candidatus Epulonipiscium sp.]
MEIAKEKGIEYAFVEADLGDVHPNTVKIVLEYNDGNHSELVGSSIGGGSIKIIQINGLDVEFTAEYPTLVIRHLDRPGVIAEVTKIMSQYNINIASMNVFRQHKGEDAFMIIETDHVVSEQIVNQIRGLKDKIISVYMIEAL